MDSASPDLTSELIDRRFRVERKLGEGGMGAVWQVQHVESLQRFALKILTGSLSYESAVVDRFRREARAAAALRTRHVVRVVDVQMAYQHRGIPLPFIVMELLEGRNLEQVMAEIVRLSPGQLIWVLRQVGRALAVAHSQGIVHRDLKPANVFIAVDEDEAPITKLCDFGIAKLINDAGKLLGSTGAFATGTGGILGTPLYMAPEQLRSARSVVPATDQWAIALISFRALTGLDYFADSESPTELVLRIAQDPMVAPTAREPGLGAAFDRWFLRACSRSPEGRFSSVTEQMDALELALGRPVPEPIDPRSPQPSCLQSTSAAFGPETNLSQALSNGTREPAAKSTHALTVWSTGAITAALIYGSYSALGAWVTNRLGPIPVSSTLGPITTPSPVSPDPRSLSMLAPLAAAQAAAPLPKDPVLSLATLRAPPTPSPAASVFPSAPASTRRPTSTAPRYPKPMTPPVEQASPANPSRARRKSGAPCSRSGECESGLCLAEACR